MLQHDEESVPILDEESFPILDEREERGVQHWMREMKSFVRFPGSGHEFQRSVTAKKDYIERPSHTTQEEDSSKSFYPRLVPIGPLHFHFSMQNSFPEGNAIKMEALRYVMETGDPHVTDDEWQGRFRSLVEHVVSCENHIRSCYKPSQGSSSLKGEIFAWLSIVDCCYFLVMSSIMSREDTPSDSSFYSSSVANEELWQKMVEDFVKLENQLPLWVVKEVADRLPGWESVADDRDCIISRRVHLGTLLRRINPYANNGECLYLLEEWQILESHMLRLLHYDVVGDPADQSMVFVGRVTFQRSILYECRMLPYKCRGFLKQKLVPLLLFPLTFPFLMAMLVPAMLVACMLPHSTRKRSGAACLRAGRFALVSPNISATHVPLTGLRHLYHNAIVFPELIRATEKEEVLIRNMIALERGNPYFRKMVSNYACFMSEFIETCEDVEFLKARYIIRQDADADSVIHMWNSLSESARLDGELFTDPNDPTTFIRNYLSRNVTPSKLLVVLHRLQKWYGVFINLYFSKAWVTVAVVAAVIVLVMTGASDWHSIGSDLPLSSFL